MCFENKFGSGVWVEQAKEFLTFYEAQCCQILLKFYTIDITNTFMENSKKVSASYTNILKIKIWVQKKIGSIVHWTAR